MTQNRGIALRYLLKFETVGTAELFRYQVLQLLIDLALYLPLLVVKLLNLVVVQLRNLVNLVLAQSNRAFQVRLELLDDDLDSSLIQLLLHQQSSGLDLRSVNLVFKLDFVHFEVINALVEQVDLGSSAVVLPAATTTFEHNGH